MGGWCGIGDWGLNVALVNPFLDLCNPVSCTAASLLLSSIEGASARICLLGRPPRDPKLDIIPVHLSFRVKYVLSNNKPQNMFF